MNGKRFFLGALSCAALLLAAAAAFVFWVDPTLTKGIEEGDTALFVNERYEMAGLIRSQDYSAIVMGTSMVANFRASWFQEGVGIKTLKVTFPDGWISEFNTALSLAFRANPELDTVYFSLDPNILIRSERDRTVELPQYLYNDNPLDDVELYLSADAIGMAAKTLRAQGNGTATGLDEAYTWDEKFSFSKAAALRGYPRPEISQTTLPREAYLDVVEENLNVVCAWLEQHPGVQFRLWFPPYSILYWDKVSREGTVDAVFAAVEYVSQRLLSYENVALYTFLPAYTVVTNLDNYTDHIHCSGDICAWVARNVMQGYWRVTKDNCQASLDELRQFVKDYDYEAIFED